MKLDYVDKIANGTMSLKEVAKTLSLKEATIAGWVANKEKLKEIDRSI